MTSKDWVVRFVLFAGTFACLIASVLQAGSSDSAWNGAYGLLGYLSLCFVVAIGAFALWRWWTRRRGNYRLTMVLVLWAVYLLAVFGAAIQSQIFIQAVRFGM